MSYIPKSRIILLFCFLLQFNIALSQVLFEETSEYTVKSIEGGATWFSDTDNGTIVYNNNGTLNTQRALLCSTDAYQSETGFKLIIEYATGSIENIAGDNFSFGLISDDTDISSYTGFNPFGTELSVYSVGINLTENSDAIGKGLNFTDGAYGYNLDESGTRTEFITGQKTKVTIEIGIGGYWSYRINDVYEASGVLLDGFDLDKSYRVAIYGQNIEGGIKSIQSIQLNKRYAQGERAKKLRGTWFSDIPPKLMDSIKYLKTLDGLRVSFTSGAVLSGQHKAPHKLLENIALGNSSVGGAKIYSVVPSWGDLSLDEPQNDPILEQLLMAKAAGFKVKAYVNSENFLGNNTNDLEEFSIRWKEYCDTNEKVQVFIDSQPYHTGIWNATTQEYEDAKITYPNRKYMFCYAEFVLKNYALRYGKHIDNWVFDDGGSMPENGDNAKSGVIEEQRIYQAYANAVHAGNPEIPVAFNNSRSSVGYFAFPYAHAVRFDDFTFGHAFGGNNNHASKEGGQFDRNYNYVKRMTETDGNVFTGDNVKWDDLIVGNFHSKISTTAWKYGPTQSWEQDDFNQWNLEAMQAGGAMTWGGSYNRGETFVRDWAIILLKGLDDYLCKLESPDTPNWTRAHTILPDASIGEVYNHVLIEGLDFWDPEEDNIISLEAIFNAPSWLTINEDPQNPGHWILSGMPTETVEASYNFELQATDENALTGVREVEIKVNFDKNYVSVTGINFTAQNISMKVGEEIALPLLISPSDASNQTVFWTSNDPLIATVSNTGVVTAIQEGTATIIATTEDGEFIDTSIVNVSKDTPNLARAYTILPDATIGEVYNYVLIEGLDFWDLEGDNIISLEAIFNAPSWLTINEDPQNPGHWILSGTPTETAEASYNFELRATDENALTGVREVEIKVNFGENYVSVTGINFTAQNISMKVGEEIALPLLISPSDASNQTVFWTSNDPLIATVSNTGVVTAIQEGTATIIATTEDGEFIDTSIVNVSGEYEFLVLFPNPTDSEVMINGGMNSIIEVFDMSGKRLLTKGIVSDSEMIDLSNFSKGTYIIKVFNLHEIVRFKILKE